MPIYGDTYPITCKETFSFPEFVSACEKSAQFIESFLRYIRISSPMTQKDISIFDHAHSMNMTSTSSFPEFVSACKKPVYSINSFLRYNQFQSPAIIVGTPIFDHTQPIFFNQLLISMNLFRYVKNQAISSFCSRHIFDLTLQSDWPSAF